jgi:hypothetical protein
MRGILSFLPIPALTGLAFICLMTGVAGRRYAVATRSREAVRPPDPAAVDANGILVDESASPSGSR